MNRLFKLHKRMLSQIIYQSEIFDETKRKTYN